MREANDPHRIRFLQLRTASFSPAAHELDQLRETDQKDLVMGLAGASETVRQKFLGNMSERVRTFIQEELAQVSRTKKGTMEEVQVRIVQQVMQLVEQGHITWPPQTRAKPKVRKKPSKQYLDMKRRLQTDVARRLDEMSNDEINTIFRSLAEVARAEGILALEALAAKMGDPFMRDAFRLAVDGTEPALIMDIMETWLQSLEHEYKRKRQKVIEGIMSIQSGDNPRIVEHKLSVLY